jgi:hypothetical protein
MLAVPVTVVVDEVELLESVPVAPVLVIVSVPLAKL